MINKVILIGNLGADPEVRHLESGASVARLRVATTENYRDKNDQWQSVTEWHTVVAWRRLAEVAERSLHKGSKVYIEGKLTHRKWQGQDGSDRYSTEVVANVLRSLDKREQQDNQPLPPFESVVSQGVQQPTSTATPTTSDTGGGGGAEEDDLPF